MSREVPFDKDASCDRCGNVGAWDFMGDYYCDECVEELEEDNEPDDA